MTSDVLIELVKHVITAPTGAYLEPMPVPVKLPEDLDWDGLYYMSAKQGVSQIAGYALKWSSDIVENGAKFAEAVDWAMALEGSMFYETGALFDAFEREGIDYCPINGLVTKKFYPLAWMRTMDDADVLIKNESLARAKEIASQLGYSYDGIIDGAASFVSASRLYRLEFHTRIDFNGTSGEADDIWNKLEPASRNGRRHEMTNIGQFVYILRRCRKHLNDGGIKVLSVLDFILLRKALGLDASVAREAVKSAGLTDIFETLGGVASAWLDYGKLTKKQSSFVDSIFSPRREPSVGRGLLSAFDRAFRSLKPRAN